jgi:ribonuclease HIII
MRIYQIIPNLKILKMDDAKKLLSNDSQIQDMIQNLRDQIDLKKDIQNIHRKYNALLNYIKNTPQLKVSLYFPLDLTNDLNLSSSDHENQSIASQMQIIIYRPSKNHSPNKETNQTTSNQSFQKCIILDQFHLNLILKIDPILHKKIGDSLDDGDEFPPFKFS